MGLQQSFGPLITDWEVKSYSLQQIKRIKILLVIFRVFYARMNGILVDQDMLSRQYLQVILAVIPF